MPLFTIDAGRCKKDGLCVMECPLQIIRMKDKDSIPEPVPGMESFCMNCGHCVAVCPTGALSLATMKADDCEQVRPEWNPGKDIIRGYMMTRRSVRKFKKTPVDKEMLASLIVTASYAPTGHNSRPVNWTVLPEREKVKEIASAVADWMRSMTAENPEMSAAWGLDMVLKAWDAGYDLITRDAPALVLVHGKKSDPNASNACVIAASHLELAAPSMGLGCCWGGYISWSSMLWKPLQEKMDLPKGHILFSALLTGYPMFKYYRVPKRDQVIFWK